MTTLIVIAKAPVPGRVKTRLSPPFTSAGCAALAEAALADTLDTVLGAASGQPILVLDGARGGWLPPGFAVIPQVQGGLDDRIAGAFAAAAHLARGPALLIGMDTPQVGRELLRPCWNGAGALVGPACDGGRCCRGGMGMPWPRPSSAGVPAQRRGPWQGTWAP